MPLAIHCNCWLKSLKVATIHIDKGAANCGALLFLDRLDALDIKAQIPDSLSAIV